MIPEKLLRVYKKSSSRDLVGGGPVRLIDELMDSGSLSHLSELSAQLSPSPHITAAHVEVPPPHTHTHTQTHACMHTPTVIVYGWALDEGLSSALWVWSHTSLMADSSTGHAQ